MAKQRIAAILRPLTKDFLTRRCRRSLANISGAALAFWLLSVAGVTNDPEKPPCEQLEPKEEGKGERPAKVSCPLSELR